MRGFKFSILMVFMFSYFYLASLKDRVSVPGGGGGGGQNTGKHR